MLLKCATPMNRLRFFGVRRFGIVAYFAFEYTANRNYLRHKIIFNNGVCIFCLLGLFAFTLIVFTFYYWLLWRRRGFMRMSSKGGHSYVLHKD